MINPFFIKIKQGDRKKKKREKNMRDLYKEVKMKEKI